MIIDKARLYLLRMNLQHPFRTSFGETKDRDMLFVCLEAGGIKGWGECVSETGPWYSGETTNSCIHIISEYLVPWIKNKEILHPKEFKEMCISIKGNQMAKACVEDAIWDLFGRIEGKSLQSLIGGTKEKIASGISLGIQQNKDILLQKIQTAVEKKYQRVKIKIEPGWDVGIIKEIRDHFPDLPLMVDANSAYRLKDKDIFVNLDRYDLLMIEQPLQYYDIIDHASLQKEISTPICLDESIKSVDDARVAIEIDATRIINVKPARIGGISETLLIHNLAKEVKIPLWCGGMLETGIGRAKNVSVASLSTFTLANDISESARYYSDYVIEPIFELNADGTLTVPTKSAGIGVEVLEDQINRNSIKKMEI